MIERRDVMPINFLKKENFTGSDTGMRYRMEKFVEKTEESERTLLRVTVWPEPYGYDATPKEKKIHSDFPFTEEGIVGGVEWLNERHPEFSVDF